MTAGSTKPIDPDKEHLDELLNEALEESFPASDPLAVTRPRRVRSDDGATAAPRNAEMTPRELTPRTQVETEEARQGTTGHGVRYVLIVGTVLAVIAGIILLVVVWR